MRRRRRGGRGGVQLGLGACSLEARVGGAEHLGRRHPETGLGAAAFLQEQSLEGVAAGAGLAEVALDGARLARQRRHAARAHACRGGGWRLWVGPGSGLLLV